MLDKSISKTALDLNDHQRKNLIEFLVLEFQSSFLLSDSQFENIIRYISKK